MKQNKGLGSVPKGLAWLEQNEQEAVSGAAREQIVSQPVMQTQMHEIPSVQKGLQQGWSRATFILKEDLIDKLKAVAYWERMTIKDVLQDALEEYFKDKNIQAIPQRKPKC